MPKRPSDICSGSVDTAVVGLMSGADVVTVPPAVLEKMFGHPLTDSGYLAFEEDIKMIKIDVEGAEGRVLKGMKEVAKRTEYLLLENHFDEDFISQVSQCTSWKNLEKT